MNAHYPRVLQPSKANQSMVNLLLLLLLILFTPAPCFSVAATATATATPGTLKPTSPLLEPASVVMERQRQQVCSSAPYPQTCLDSISTQKLSIAIHTPSILTFALQTLLSAITSAAKLSSLLSSVSLVEHQRGALQDCRQLHDISLSSLRKSANILKSSSSNIAGVKTYLTAALTNKATCLESLAGATGSGKPVLISALQSSYQHVSNSLSLVSNSAGRSTKHGRRLSGKLDHMFPSWIQRRDRKLLQSSDDDDDGDEYQGLVLTVTRDGSGNFTTVSDAVAFAPDNSDQRTFIIVSAGVYDEHVEVPSSKTNVVLLGEGSDVTVITGNRSAGDGWTTFRSATVAVSGQGFLARDIAFQNTAGPSKSQAVAVRVNADLVAFYRCSFIGYQDTLYAHSFRQFYRECDIYGTVDFVFGNSAAVLQACNLFARLPLPGQFNVITAQGRDDPNEDSGIVVQNCSVVAADDLASSNVNVKTYLGRPWKNYSRTVYMESYLDSLVDPSGWTEWIGDQGLDTLYCGEYENSGPRSGTQARVSWPGFHVMDYDDAFNFTVSEFIYADQWLDSTSFPYDDGV